MNNNVTIILTGNTALDYLRDKNLNGATIEVLQELVETKDKEISQMSRRNEELSNELLSNIQEVNTLATSLGNLQQEYDILDNKYQAIIPQQDLSYRIARDTDSSLDVLQHTIPTTESDDSRVLNQHDEVKHRELSKLKTRLSKQDIIDLGDLAGKNFTSLHKVDEFAKIRNLRPSTVKTYIKKHSEDKYTIVRGYDIRTSDMDYKFSVVKNALYFTLNDGRYDSSHIQL